MNGHNESNVWVTGWRVYEGKALKVSMTLNLVDFGETPFEAIGNIHTFIAHEVVNGLLPNEPGLEKGEQKEIVNYVMRVNHKQDDRVTPRIFFYREKYKRTSKYLNTPEDITEFEQWSGLKLASITPYPGKGALIRGEDTDADKQFITALPSPMNIVWRHNPEYEGEGDKKHEKYSFVRYNGDASKSRQDSPRNGGSAPAKENVQEWPATPQNGDGSYDVHFVSVKVMHKGAKRQYLLTTKSGHEVFEFSRDKFKAAGYIGEEDWQEDGLITFDDPIPAKITKNERTGYWKVTHVMAIEF